jgi:uncharacterized protein (TIGR03000 family)
MYSVVLMLAVTGGADSVDFGGRGCNGCNGGGCHGAVACNGGGCHGGRDRCHGGGLFSRHGCNGGCHGTVAVSHGCSSACNGGGCHGRDRCHGGGLFSRLHNRCNGGNGCHGCNGGGCHGGCSSSSACHGCTGGTVVTPSKGAEPVKVDPKTMPKKQEEEANAAPATIVVTLPAEAKLTVDGNATQSTSDRRTFVTPALETGADFVYTLRAEVVQDGQVSIQTRDVTVRSGQTTEVSFTFASQGVASR